jgi:hypothetical protein
MVTYGRSYIQRGFGNGSASVDEGVGEYLADFDFEGNEGRGKLTLTPDARKAKRFASAGDVLVFIQQIPKCQPKRDDGRPNRPLTDLGWEVEAKLEQSLTDECRARGARTRSPIVPSPVVRRRKPKQPPGYSPPARQRQAEQMDMTSDQPTLWVEGGQFEFRSAELPCPVVSEIET